MTDPIAIASRAFNSETDVAQLESFLLDVVAKRPPHTYWHIGNLFWSLYFGMKYSLERDVRLWEDQDGALLGFAWFEDPGSVDLQVHPSLRGSGLLETPMLAWAAEHAVGFRHDREPTLNVAAAPDDTELLEYLLAQGFEQDGFSMACMIRDLDGPVPKPSLPAGWSVRHVADETEWLERVEAHRDAWNPSSHTIQAYRRCEGRMGTRQSLTLLRFPRMAPLPLTVCSGSTRSTGSGCWSL